MSISELRRKGGIEVVKELLMVGVPREQLKAELVMRPFFYGIKGVLYLLFLLKLSFQRMRMVFTIMMIMTTAGAFAQKNNVWISYYDTVLGKAGYKDVKGDVMIPPTFIGVSEGDSFYNIAAVTAEINEKYSSYYLLRDGRKVGTDSVYMFDFTFDCESEEKILFNDRKTDRVGFFDKNGKVVVPAVYNAATPFRNGLSFALQNAKRKCWDSKSKDCEHWGWDGGQQRLINERNEILIDSTSYPFYQLDMYSMKMNTPGLDTSVYVNLPGRDGKIYSFIDVHKEFKHWLNKRFIPGVKGPVKEWASCLFDVIAVDVAGIASESFLPDAFVQKMEKRMLSSGFTEDTMTRIDVSREWFSAIGEDNTEAFRQYYKACGGYDVNRYPLFNVTVSHYRKRAKPYKPAGRKLKNVSRADQFYLGHDIDFRETYCFIRTADGFKLYEVSGH